MKIPDPHQVVGAEFLLNRKRAGLFDDMGVGKTLQAIIAASHVSHSPRIRVVCNASAVPVWEAAFADEWMRFGDMTLNVMSYEGAVKFVQDKVKATCLFDVLICDEAHYIKNKDAKRSKAVEMLVKHADYAWGLTGTPALNHLGEMYNLLRLFAPDALVGIKSEFEFWNRYTYVRDTNWGPKPVGRRNVTELKQRLEGHVLRRMLDEVQQGMPPARWGDIALQADGLELSEEDNKRLEQAAARLSVGSAPPVSEHSTTTRRLLEVAKARPLSAYLADELRNSAPDHKLVIFGWFNEALDIVEDELREFGVARITGSTSKSARAAATDAFQTGSDRVFVGQILAAGTAINLTASHNLVFLGLDWVPGNNAQAAMRVRRRGQMKPVLFRTATLLGTMDGIVQEVVARKTRDIMSVWEEETPDENTQ